MSTKKYILSLVSFLVVMILLCLVMSATIELSKDVDEIKEQLSEPDEPLIIDSNAEEFSNEPEVVYEEVIAVESSSEEVISNLDLLKEIALTIRQNKQLSCDTDGAEDACGSKTWQKNTSYLYQGGSKKYWGKSLDATKINYIVYNSSKYYGYVGLVVDIKTGNYVFVICGDYNSHSHWQEMSLATLRNLGYKNAWGNNAPKGNFVSIILNDSKLQLGSPTNTDIKIENKVRDILSEKQIDINELIQEIIAEYK